MYDLPIKIVRGTRLRGRKNAVKHTYGYTEETAKKAPEMCYSFSQGVNYAMLAENSEETIAPIMWEPVGGGSEALSYLCRLSSGELSYGRVYSELMGSDNDPPESRFWKVWIKYGGSATQMTLTEYRGILTPPKFGLSAPRIKYDPANDCYYTDGTTLSVTISDDTKTTGSVGAAVVKPVTAAGSDIKVNVVQTSQDEVV